MLIFLYIEDSTYIIIVSRISTSMFMSEIALNVDLAFYSSGFYIRDLVTWRLSIEELMLSNCGAGEDSWKSFGQQGDQTSQPQRKPTLNIHWKDWGWSSNTLAAWCKEPTSVPLLCQPYYLDLDGTFMNKTFRKFHSDKYNKH